MLIAVLNAGSATMKVALGDVSASDRASEVMWDVRATIRAEVGGWRVEGSVRGESVDEPLDPEADSISEATLAWLEQTGFADDVAVVGHRVVHGGPDLIEPVVVDDEVLASIERASELAPLHNAPALEALRDVRESLADVPNVAVFDTAFHAHLVPAARHYPIDPELAHRHRIRRYGFHGLAHRWMTERFAAISERDVRESRLVTLQLGSGCSAAAIRDGHSIDTSMGLTPLEGLMMRTRSGDVDPSLALFLAAREAVAPGEVEAWLNRRSGLAAIGGHDGDMRELLEAEAAGDADAALALDMFCHRVRARVGAYLAVLGGADAVIFGGGIGEHAPPVRERVLEGFEWCGLRLDRDANAAADGTEGRLTEDGSDLEAWVLPVDEAAVIAVDAARLLA